MASNYTGVRGTFYDTLSLLTGSDLKTASTVRNPIERLLDNDAELNHRIAYGRRDTYLIYDDFVVRSATGASDLKTLQYEWVPNSAGAASWTPTIGDTDFTAIGEFNVENASGSSGSYSPRIGALNSLKIADLEFIRVRIQLGDVDLANQLFEVGLFAQSNAAARHLDVSEHGISLIHDYSGESNNVSWFLRGTTGNVEDTVEIPNSDPADDSYITLQVDFADGTLTASANDGTASAEPSVIPGGGALVYPGLKFTTPAAGTRSFKIDYVVFALATNGNRI